MTFTHAIQSINDAHQKQVERYHHQKGQKDHQKIASS